MKELYSFYVTRKDKKQVTKEVEGGKLLTEVEELTNKRVVLKQPNARENESARATYAVEWSKGVRDGLLTRGMLTKIYKDHGGLMADKDVEEYHEILKTLHKKQLEFYQLGLKPQDDVEAQEKLKAITKELGDLYQHVQLFEMEQAQAFEQTAESHAKNKTIQWLTLNLTYIEENDSLVPFFKGRSDAEKEDYYYLLIEDENKFNSDVIEKAILMWSFLYSGRAASKEDFEYMEKQLNDPE